MPRIPRLVVPGYPHHVTQRGNRRQRTFFNTQDYKAYSGFITEALPKAKCEIWAYCFMPNHVHFVIVPQHTHGLALLFLERYPDWKEYLGGRQSAEMLQNVRKNTRTGRPLGNGQFIETLESLTGRSLKRQKPGRKPIK